MKNFEIYNFVWNSDFEKKMTGKWLKLRKTDCFLFFDVFSNVNQNMQNVIFLVVFYVKPEVLQYWSSKTIP